MPFWADNELELGNVILKNEVEFNSDRDVSVELKQLIKKMLTKNPKKRPSLEEVLEHDFFTTST